MTLRSHQNVEKPKENIEIELSEPVALTFSLKYLVNFCKASALSEQVKICLSNEVPLLVEYTVQGMSYLRFYLAPKVRFPSVAYLRASCQRNTNNPLIRLVMRSNRSGVPHGAWTRNKNWEASTIASTPRDGHRQGLYQLRSLGHKGVLPNKEGDWIKLRFCVSGAELKNCGGDVPGGCSILHYLGTTRAGRTEGQQHVALYEMLISNDNENIISPRGLVGYAPSYDIHRVLLYYCATVLYCDRLLQR